MECVQWNKQSPSLVIRPTSSEYNEDDHRQPIIIEFNDAVDGELKRRQTDN